MSIRRIEIDPMLPHGYYKLVLHGLPGYPKTVAGIGGRDVGTGEMWQASVWANPVYPVDSQPVFVPTSVPYTRVVSADEMLEECLLERSLDVADEYGEVLNTAT